MFYFQEISTGDPPRKKVLAHEVCRRDFTDIKRSLPPVKVSEAVTKRLRSSMEPFTWKENCFLCAKEAAIVDSKHPNRRKIVHHAVTIGLKSKILEQCQKRNDKWSVEVETRLSCSMDLVADEGMNHSECLSRFMSFKPPNEKSLGFAGRPTEQKLLLSFNNLCKWLENEADGELHSNGITCKNEGISWQW